MDDYFQMLLVVADEHIDQLIAESYLQPRDKKNILSKLEFLEKFELQKLNAKNLYPELCKSLHIIHDSMEKIRETAEIINAMRANEEDHEIVHLVRLSLMLFSDDKTTFDNFVNQQHIDTDEDGEMTLMISAVSGKLYFFNYFFDDYLNKPNSEICHETFLELLQLAALSGNKQIFDLVYKSLNDECEGKVSIPDATIYHAIAGGNKKIIGQVIGDQCIETTQTLLRINAGYFSHCMGNNTIINYLNRIYDISPLSITINHFKQITKHDETDFRLLNQYLTIDEIKRAIMERQQLDMLNEDMEIDILPDEHSNEDIYELSGIDPFITLLFLAGNVDACNRFLQDPKITALESFNQDHWLLLATYCCDFGFIESNSALFETPEEKIDSDSTADSDISFILQIAIRVAAIKGNKIFFDHIKSLKFHDTVFSRDEGLVIHAIAGGNIDIVDNILGYPCIDTTQWLNKITAILYSITWLDYTMIEYLVLQHSVSLYHRDISPAALIYTHNDLLTWFINSTIPEVLGLIKYYQSNNLPVPENWRNTPQENSTTSDITDIERLEQSLCFQNKKFPNDTLISHAAWEGNPNIIRTTLNQLSENDMFQKKLLNQVCSKNRTALEWAVKKLLKPQHKKYSRYNGTLNREIRRSDIKRQTKTIITLLDFDPQINLDTFIDIIDNGEEELRNKCCATTAGKQHISTILNNPNRLAYNLKSRDSKIMQTMAENPVLLQEMIDDETIDLENTLILTIESSDWISVEALLGFNPAMTLATFAKLFEPQRPRRTHFFGKDIENIREMCCATTAGKEHICEILNDPELTITHVRMNDLRSQIMYSLLKDSRLFEAVLELGLNLTLELVLSPPPFNNDTWLSWAALGAKYQIVELILQNLSTEAVSLLLDREICHGKKTLDLIVTKTQWDENIWHVVNVLLQFQSPMSHKTFETIINKTSSIDTQTSTDPIFHDVCMQCCTSPNGKHYIGLILNGPYQPIQEPTPHRELVIRTMVSNPNLLQEMIDQGVIDDPNQPIQELTSLDKQVIRTMAANPDLLQEMIDERVIDDPNQPIQEPTSLHEQVIRTMAANPDLLQEMIDEGVIDLAFILFQAVNSKYWAAVGPLLDVNPRMSLSTFATIIDRSGLDIPHNALSDGKRHICQILNNPELTLVDVDMMFFRRTIIFKIFHDATLLQAVIEMGLILTLDLVSDYPADGSNNTWLSEAVLQENIEVIQLIVDNLSLNDRLILLNLKNNEGQTALQVAINENHWDAARVLSEFDPQISFSTNNETPEDNINYGLQYQSSKDGSESAFMTMPGDKTYDMGIGIPLSVLSILKKEANEIMKEREPSDDMSDEGDFDDSNASPGPI